MFEGIEYGRILTLCERVKSFITLFLRALRYLNLKSIGSISESKSRNRDNDLKGELFGE